MSEKIKLQNVLYAKKIERKVIFKQALKVHAAPSVVYGFCAHFTFVQVWLALQNCLEILWLLHSVHLKWHYILTQM